ncbi:MAG: HlyU family transcriptional regulator [Acidiferrobacterales bacterium]|nr:HlyU family transcriptional regulator [Acidiferrobacterales bacterium]
MVLKFLRTLISGETASPGPTTNAEPVHYQGYTIVATPREVGAGWTTEGDITKEVGGIVKSQHFIRIDTHSNRSDAISFSILKAKKIIDEQGDVLFGRS